MRSDAELLQIVRDTYSKAIDMGLCMGLCAINRTLRLEVFSDAEYSRVEDIILAESTKRNKINDYWAPRFNTDVRMQWLNQTIESLKQ